MVRLSWVLSLGSLGKAQRPAVLWGHVERGKACDTRRVSCEKTQLELKERIFLKCRELFCL